MYPPPLILADGNIVINPETINIYTLDTDQQIKGVYIFSEFCPCSLNSFLPVQGKLLVRWLSSFFKAYLKGRLAIFYLESFVILFLNLDKLWVEEGNLLPNLAFFYSLKSKFKDKKVPTPLQWEASSQFLRRGGVPLFPPHEAPLMVKKRFILKI